jgi:hypothetical protein
MLLASAGLEMREQLIHSSSAAVSSSSEQNTPRSRHRLCNSANQRSINRLTELLDRTSVHEEPAQEPASLPEAA